MDSGRSREQEPKNPQLECLSQNEASTDGIFSFLSFFGSGNVIWAGLWEMGTHFPLQARFNCIISVGCVGIILIVFPALVPALGLIFVIAKDLTLAVSAALEMLLNYLN